MDLVKWRGKLWAESICLNRGLLWALVNTVMNLRVPQEAGNFLTSRVTVIFLRKTLLHGGDLLIWCDVTIQRKV